VNIAIAFVLFWAVLLSGSLNGMITLHELVPSVSTYNVTTAVESVERGSAAEGVLRPGDRIVAVDGQAVSVQGAIRAIGSHRCAGTAVEGCRAATPVKLTVRRAGRLAALSVYPRYDAKAKRMLVGFGFGLSAKAFGVVGAAGTAASSMWHLTADTLTNFFKALTSSKARHQVSSIVGITQYAHESVVAGAGYALVFLGFISLVLAVINLFPFLPLDGGHIAWALAEKLRGRRISLMAMYRYSSVGIILLLFLVVNGISNDINRLAG
jgi:regulator of sigma E protease